MQIDATPQKRIFLSIIADYDLNTAVCELIDNAVDHWIDGGRRRELLISVRAIVDRQTLIISDNSGGVEAKDLQLLVAPGATREKVQEGLIGNFGVGGKRAGIALGELVEVRTRSGSGPTFEFELSDKWLSSQDWDVEAYEVEAIAPDTTVVRISKLRQGFDESAVSRLKLHISATYTKLFNLDCKIEFDGISLGPIPFDNWAYPPEYPPIERSGSLTFGAEDDTVLGTKITAGLIRDRDPKEDNYGVYFYCNNRLILSHEKSHQVGFLQGYAGVPHPDASLCRVIVELNGLPTLMPWNSSKSGINWSHPAFLKLREEIFALATRFSTISRRLKNDREKDVYPYGSGDISKSSLDPSTTGKEIVSLPVPRGRRKNYADRILEENEKQYAKKPWVKGLVEAMGIADIVYRRKSSTKNRIALIVLDSNFEIALKEYLVHQKKKYYDDSQIASLFKSRNNVLNEVSGLTNLPKRDIELARHYANLRNKLIHERATVDIPDSDIIAYRQVVQRVLKTLFNVDVA